MPSELESAVEYLVKVFYKYSGKEGDKYKLSKTELKLMLEEQFGELAADCKDTSLVDEIMKALDEDKDGEVDFKEFVTMIATFTLICHEFFTEMK